MVDGATNSRSLSPLEPAARKDSSSTMQRMRRELAVVAASVALAAGIAIFPAALAEALAGSNLMGMSRCIHRRRT